MTDDDKESLLERSTPSSIPMKEEIKGIEKPDNSITGRVLAFISIILSIYLGVAVDLYVGIGGFGVVLIILGVDGAVYLNHKLRTEKKAEADYFFRYAVGAILIAINLSFTSWWVIQTYQPEVASNIPFFSSVAIGVILAIAYLYVIVQVTLYKIDNVKVRKDPHNPMDRFYIFDELEYVSRLEERKLEQANSNDN